MGQNGINKQLRYVLQHSAFYQNKFRDYLDTRADPALRFKELPFTTKSELLCDQRANPPYGSNLCIRTSDIQRIHKTSGTTDRPLLVALGKGDIEVTVDVGAKCFALSGLTPGDTVVHCLNYNMWAGGYTDHQSLENTGAAVIPFGVGHTKELIDTMLWIRPSAIHCTPSYLKKIEAVMTDTFGMCPADLRLRLGLFGGESGLQNRDFRNRIESTWKIKAMNANYGLSDVMSIFGSECGYQDGLHFMGDEILYPEVIAAGTQAGLPIEAEIIGELVLTNLCKKAQPLVRYRTSDIVRIISTDKCRCGYSGFRFEIVGRSDDMFVFKGVNVHLSAIGAILGGHLDLLSGEYQVHINKSEPVDRMIIILELNGAFKSTMPDSDFLSDEIYEKLSFRPQIRFEFNGSLPRSEGKTRRLFRSL